MAPPNSPDDDGRRDLLRLWLPSIALTVLGFVVAWRYAGAAPPSSLRIATGAAGGGYEAAGEHFREEFERAGIALELVPTRGSVENLALLRAGEVDLGLVQGGVVGVDEPELAGVVSLYLEPLWIAAREPLERLDGLAGKRVEIGEPGSGTHALATRLLDSAGVAVEALEHPPDEALEALVSGAADALLSVAAPRSARARGLFVDELVLADLARAEGIARTLTFLEPVHVAPGAIDLAADLPERGIDTVAAAANLVANADLHPAIVALLVEAARLRFGERGVLEDEGEFPNLALLDVAPSLAARRAFANGPSFLYRVLPFQVAALVDRLKILLLPIVTLVLPFVRFAPPLYRWRIRRRILAWYERVLELEQRLRADGVTREECEGAAAELDRFDAELAAVKVPLSYADELYHLRLHLRMVREDLRTGRGRWASLG